MAGGLVGVLLFGFLLPFISQVIEVQRVKMTIGIIDSFEVLYTYLRYPTYWSLGIIQVVISYNLKPVNEYKSLIADLKEAEVILSKCKQGFPSGKYLSAEEFHQDIKKGIVKLEKGDQNVLNDLISWFSPTCQWDDYGGQVELGERIFKNLNHLKKTASR